MSAIFYALATLKDKLGDKERGATAIEYALVVGLVSIALIVAILALGTGLDGIITQITGWLGEQEIGG